jgi:hypothetical protein
LLAWPNESGKGWVDHRYRMMSDSQLR